MSDLNVYSYFTNGRTTKPQADGLITTIRLGFEIDARRPKTGFPYIQPAGLFILREIRETDAYIQRHGPRDSGDISQGHIRVA